MGVKKKQTQHTTIYPDKKGNKRQQNYLLITSYVLIEPIYVYCVSWLDWQGL